MSWVTNTNEEKYSLNLPRIKTLSLVLSQKRQHISLFWSMSLDAAVIVNFPHRFWLNDSTRFWPIWYPNVLIVFADYIHIWTNLNSVINAGSLDGAKEDSKTYFAGKRVQPRCFRDLHTMDELTRIPRFASFFRIFALVVSSSLRICWSMKAHTSMNSFFGLPERGKFAAEPVRRSFLIERAWKAHL